MASPVEQITAACRRLRRVAALRAALALVLPALTALALAATLGAIGAVTWERIGYALAPTRFGALRVALLLGGLGALAGCAAMAWRAWRRADDFLDAAARVDDAVGAHQEIVTLASLADPAKPAGGRARRTPLFPLLWRRAAEYLERFDPAAAFAFEVRRPLTRSLPMTAATIVILAAAAFALVRPPTPGELQARKLRAEAERLAASPSKPDRDAASKVMGAARALENPDLPPEEKLQRLADAMSALQTQPPQQPSAEKSAGASGAGNGQGGKGKGSRQGQGQDQGNGKGQSQGAGNNPGQNPGGHGNKQQIVELQNDLSKAQAQIETGAASRSKAPSPGQGARGNALKPGKSPNQKGPSEQPNGLAQGNLPRPDAAARGQMPSGGARSGNNEKGGHGDTHLGEFPAAENFQRFYKPGEGPAVQIRDARYVVFRLPTEIVSASGGKLAADTNRPTASVPYTNVPLKAERLDAAPEERQLVPPRYRDLIR